MSSELLMDLAIIPGIVLAIIIYKQDKIEKEPKGLLIKLGIMGALTVISAYILESVGFAVLGWFWDEYSLEYIVLSNIVVVAGAEELGKFIVTKKLTWNHRAFNYRFDAVVYSVCASLGFAIVENVKYANSFGLATTLLRAVTAVPAHTIFAIFMGHFYGQAKFYHMKGEERKSKLYMREAYLVPVLIHGLYDIFAGDGTVLGFLIFLVFIIGMYVFAYYRVRIDSRGDIGV